MIGKISRSAVIFEWSIENFFSLSEKDSPNYFSPNFSYGGEKWHLWIYPDGEYRCGTSDFVDLELWKHSGSRSIKLQFSFSLKTANGQRYNEKNYRMCCDSGHDYGSYRMFIRRKEIFSRQSELVPNGVLTVVITMKNITSVRLPGECKSLDAY